MMGWRTRVALRPGLYRFAKRCYPLWAGLSHSTARVARRLGALPVLRRVLLNPVRVATALSLSGGDDTGENGAGIATACVYSNVTANRVLPQSLDGELLRKFDQVRTAESGPGCLYTLHRACVWGRDGAVFTDDRVLLSDLSPVIRVPPDAHPVFRHPLLRRPTTVEGTAAVITGPSPHNLAHWLYGVVPRLLLLWRRDPGFAGVDRVILPSLTCEFQRATIGRFAVPASKVVEADNGTFLRVDRLIAPSFVSPAHVAPEWLLRGLNEIFDGYGDSAGYERVYISRDDAIGRRVINEDELLPILERRGFRKVLLSGLQLSQQIGIFRGAQTIVAAHGAGLSLLAFCRPGTKVIEIFSPSYVNLMYWCVADTGNLDYQCCMGEDGQHFAQINHELVRADILVNLQSLLNILNRAEGTLG